MNKFCAVFPREFFGGLLESFHIMDFSSGYRPVLKDIEPRNQQSNGLGTYILSIQFHEILVNYDHFQIYLFVKICGWAKKP